MSARRATLDPEASSRSIGQREQKSTTISLDDYNKYITNTKKKSLLNNHCLFTLVSDTTHSLTRDGLKDRQGDAMRAREGSRTTTTTNNATGNFRLTFLLGKARTSEESLRRFVGLGVAGLRLRRLA